MFSYVSVEQRVPADHPIRKLRVLVDTILAGLDAEFSSRYAKHGRPSIPPERLLRAALLQVVYSATLELGAELPSLRHEHSSWPKSAFS